MYYAATGSPVGTIHMLATDRGLAAIYFDAQIEDMQKRFPSSERKSGRGK